MTAREGVVKAARDRCATCTFYRETCAFGGVVGVCDQTGATVAENGGCDKHKGRE
jgi:hypothetical protein